MSAFLQGGVLSRRFYEEAVRPLLELQLTRHLLNKIRRNIALVDDAEPSIVGQRAFAQGLQGLHDIVAGQLVGAGAMRQAKTIHDSHDFAGIVLLQAAHQLDTEADEPAMYEGAARQ